MKMLNYVFLYTLSILIYFSLTKAPQIMSERVTTYYQTLQTWIGHNETRYHNFNVLPQASSHALPYIYLGLALFGAICKGLSCVTVKLKKK